MKPFVNRRRSSSVLRYNDLVVLLKLAQAGLRDRRAVTHENKNLRRPLMKKSIATQSVPSFNMGAS